MPDTPPQVARQTIVTLNSLRPPRAPEGTMGDLRPTPRTPEEQLLQARYDQIMQRLQQETARTGDALLVTMQDPEVSRVQSEIARLAEQRQAAPAGALEVMFGTGFAGGDWFGWLRSLFDHVDRSQAHGLVRPATTTPEPFPNSAKVAMTADWGTGLYGAPKIADVIRQRAPFDLLLHLGDVYYSGTLEEVQHRFLDVWPKQAGAISRTLNSNHEMYSGGFGYFDLALPAINQKSSYFAMQNDNWLLLFLDTAYVDHDMDTEQVAWVNLVIQQQTTQRKIVLFSHQQLFSRLDNQGPKLHQALRPLLEQRRITAWYWGHEHQCVIYEPHPTYGLLGRCLGNGGIPEPRKREVKEAPTARAVGDVAWKQMAATADSPRCIALDGPNPDVTGEEQKFVPHGFMTLEFNGPALTERVFLAHGAEIFNNTIS